MVHPFETIFNRALKKSTLENNVVLREAEKMQEKGYSSHEISTVLKKMKNARIDPIEEQILEEAAVAFDESYDTE